VATTTVFIRTRAKDDEAERILDRLESLTGLHGARADAGRSYDLTEARDLVIAMASIKGQLDAISDAWPSHLEIDIDPG
jgi:hypothetical protein